MKISKQLCIISSTVLYLINSQAQPVQCALPPEQCGIYSWCSWSPRQVSKEQCPQLRGVPIILNWGRLEPQQDNYLFEQELGERLKAAHSQGLVVHAMIWVGPTAPEWLYEAGVPKVYTDRKVNPLGKEMSREDNRFPYYLHPLYKERFFRVIDAFGAYINELPKELQKSIVFIQSCEGSTGDGQPYKGEPLDTRYAISKDQWSRFRMETWSHLQKNFPDMPIVVNSDANESAESNWQLANMNTIALKHGMFSHGYHVSDNTRRLAEFKSLQAEAVKKNKSMLTRGEMDGELFVMGWSKNNIPQALYWSALFATHCELDIWNIPSDALKDPANTPAFAFFNRYAGHHNPATSPSAFCALRDGLDASDFNRFPVDTYGGKPGNKSDVQRYIKIATAFKKQGARMDDPEKATKGGMVNRKRSGPNDVGWGILPSNYCRFLEQIEPGSGDIGLWNIDESIYGRFARSFDHRNGRRLMRFKLNDRFSAKTIKVYITYLDRGNGEWSLNYNSRTGLTAALRNRNSDSGKWQCVSVVINAPLYSAEQKTADFELRYESGDDTVFHLIEVE